MYKAGWDRPFLLTQSLTHFVVSPTPKPTSLQAREKVGQSLRDLLHGKYKSSTKAKWRRRRVEINDEVDALVQSNMTVNHRMKQLSEQIGHRASLATGAANTTTDVPDSSGTSDLSDAELIQLFTQANCDVLSALKSDNQLMHTIMTKTATAAGSTNGRINTGNDGEDDDASENNDDDDSTSR